MKFIVSRSSEYGAENLPCENTVKENVFLKDKRTFKTPEEHDEVLVL